MKVSIIILFTLAPVAFGERNQCNISRSGSEERCFVQFKTDAYSLAQFNEAIAAFRSIGWTTPPAVSKVASPLALSTP
ncbi:hypothetical protein L0F63_000831 [Massospora cicadina]|nr:hypothetical protein L0F63_000831 [Massospora cicadina]